MTLTADEIAFLRREAQIPNNTFSCADMLRVLDALDEFEPAGFEVRDLIIKAGDALVRAEKAEASAAVMRAHAITETEWATIERERNTRKRRKECPHLSIEAGSERCLTCGEPNATHAKREVTSPMLSAFATDAGKALLNEREALRGALAREVSRYETIKRWVTEDVVTPGMHKVLLMNVVEACDAGIAGLSEVKVTR